MSAQRSQKSSSTGQTPQRRKKETNNYRTNTPSTLKDNNAVKKSRMRSSQLTIIILLLFIAMILSLLVYLFFQPERIQLWQEQLIPSVQNSHGLPDVKRLLPEDKKIPEITELPSAVDDLKPEETQEAKTSEPAKSTRNARLFFVKVNMEGQITLKSIIRPVLYNSSPLTETINSLLNGPSSDEINKGSLTLIPDGTRLLSARVEETTAYLNFNEAFRFNSLGREGYTAQLKQIVYTSTEFSNIQMVQIMIDGSIKEYLGGEGLFVGEPLSRETFQTTP